MADNKEAITSEEIFDEPKKILSDVLVELGKKDERVVFVSCDTSLGTGADEFKKNFPERHFDFGIAEQNALTQSAGMAYEGKIPILGAHVPFISIKVLEQIRDDICRTNLHVILIGRDFGFQAPTAGPTHMIFEDIGILRTIPNMTIIAPCDGPEYRQALYAAYEYDRPVYIRMSRIKTKRVNNDGYKFKIGRANLLKEGSDITLFSTSTLVSNTLDAAWLLHKKGISAEVINIHTLKPIDRELILKSCIKTGKAVTVEEHSVINGLGTAVADTLIKEHPIKIKMIGMEDIFSIVGANYLQLIDHYGFTPAKIADKVEKYILGL
ncbi:MAG: transketolase family protein [Candidatus Humimicrobiaceae bacterium]